MLMHYRHTYCSIEGFCTQGKSFFQTFKRKWLFEFNIQIAYWDKTKRFHYGC